MVSLPIKEQLREDQTMHYYTFQQFIQLHTIGNSCLIVKVVPMEGQTPMVFLLLSTTACYDSYSRRQHYGSGIAFWHNCWHRGLELVQIIWFYPERFFLQDSIIHEPIFIKSLLAVVGDLLLQKVRRSFREKCWGKDQGHPDIDQHDASFHPNLPPFVTFSANTIFIAKYVQILWMLVRKICKFCMNMFLLNPHHVRFPNWCTPWFCTQLVGSALRWARRR